MSRDELVARLSAIGRETSGAVVLYHAAVATSVGLGAGDHKLLDILLRTGAVTAGELANQSGLTTGAITGAIDRLTARGFVQREDDPVDRRKVIIAPNLPAIQAAFSASVKAIMEEYADLFEPFTDNDLVKILEYQGRALSAIKRATARLAEPR